jgi:hypothetical protein
VLDVLAAPSQAFLRQESDEAPDQMKIRTETGDEVGARMAVEA